jgi:hypothetical protein
LRFVPRLALEYQRARSVKRPIAAPRSLNSSAGGNGDAPATNGTPAPTDDKGIQAKPK